MVKDKMNGDDGLNNDGDVPIELVIQRNVVNAC